MRLIPIKSEIKDKLDGIKYVREKKEKTLATKMESFEATRSQNTEVTIILSF